MLKACPWCSARGDEPPLELRTKVYSLLQARCDALEEKLDIATSALLPYADPLNWYRLDDGNAIVFGGTNGTTDGYSIASEARDRILWKDGVEFVGEKWAFERTHNELKDQIELLTSQRDALAEALRFIETQLYEPSMMYYPQHWMQHAQNTNIILECHAFAKATLEANGYGKKEGK